jgi:hypothetical protein
VRRFAAAVECGDRQPVARSKRPSSAPPKAARPRGLQARGYLPPAQRPGLTRMRAVQITRFGGPVVMDIVDLPEPTPGDGQRTYEVSSAGVNCADTHHP